MNWRPLLITLFVLLFIASLVRGAIWGPDDIDTQVHRVQESITERMGNDTWDLRNPDCPRFDELVDGETVTCTADAVDSAGESSPATVVATLRNCHRQEGDNLGHRCEFSSKWKVE